MAISYFIRVPSFKSTAFVVWILTRGCGGRGVNFPPCFNATSERPCTIGLTSSALEAPVSSGEKFPSDNIQNLHSLKNR